jgi:hypothetical protein
MEADFLSLSLSSCLINLAMSVIYYKFKAAKDSDYDVFTFDGQGATVFDVKREIIRAKKLGKGTDFDLAIYNAQTDEGKKERRRQTKKTMLCLHNSIDVLLVWILE